MTQQERILELLNSRIQILVDIVHVTEVYRMRCREGMLPHYIQLMQ